MTNSPMVTTMLLIRHGETAWNREKRLQGQIDIALSEVGEQQAQRLAERFAANIGSNIGANNAERSALPLATRRVTGTRTTPTVDVVLSSDLSRAMQTAAPLAQVLGLTVMPVPSLRERHYGVFQAATRDQIALQWPDAHARWMGNDADFAPEGGESIRQLSHRVLSTLAVVARTYAGKTVVCVTHGGVLDCAYRFAAPLPLDAPRQHALLNASVNTIEWHVDEIHQDAGHFAERVERGADQPAIGMARVVAWGDVDHLQEAKDDTV